MHAKTQEAVDVQIHGRTLPHPPHVCAFFNSKEEEFRVLGQFIQDGVEQGEKALHIVDARAHADHLRRLREIAPDADAYKRGQIEVKLWEDAYLKDGYFDQNRQLALIEALLQQGRVEGYERTRLVANMEWALEDRAGVEDIVEYEARLNYILPKYIDPVICTYDLTRFSGDVVMDMLRTHPLVIVGGVLQENPFYIPPDEFLKELTARRAGH